jgi:hypothetical protein
MEEAWTSETFVCQMVTVFNMNNSKHFGINSVPNQNVQLTTQLNRELSNSLLQAERESIMFRIWLFYDYISASVVMQH